MKKIIIATIALLTTSLPQAYSHELPIALETLLRQHPHMKSTQNDYSAANMRKSAKFRDRWLPEFNLSYNWGYQDYEPVEGDSSNENPQEFTAKVEQRLYDFGTASSELEADQYSLMQKEENIKVVSQDLLMSALDSYLRVQRAKAMISYSTQSRDNIVNQTELENTLVEKGKGYSSNVLQAKTQLVGAEARLNQDKSALVVALAELDALFKDAADDFVFDEQFDIVSIVLPDSLETALSIAFNNNPLAKVGEYRTKTFKENVKYENRNAFFPELKLVGQMNRTRDLDGNLGTEQDDRVMLQINWPINLGLSGLKHTEAAEKEVSRSLEDESQTRREIEKAVKIAWRNHLTAKENLQLLQTKVNIAEEFLRLAREERKSGRRTLLEVLTAETTLINSQSELLGARNDMIRTAFSLLYAMGKLNMDVIQNAINGQQS